MAQSKALDLDTVISRVKKMAYDNSARKIVTDAKYSIHNITWEDCARNKESVWGPCISDMTLQVDSHRMPVIRKNNYTDITWDVELEKIPIVVGNEQIIEKDNNNNNFNFSNPNDEMKQSNVNDNQSELKTITLKEYLRNFDEYMSKKPLKKKKNKSNFPLNAVNIFEDNNNKTKVNLLRKDESKDSHCIVTSQACFLPISQGNETKFNVAIYNYQSEKQNPAVLAIVASSKGTSAQIIEGSDQKLLFNNNGIKADFIGQRLTDNRIERGIMDLNAAMSKEEKQDNCIVIIQVPLKQKARNNNNGGFWGSGLAAGFGGFGNNNNNNDSFSFGGMPQQQMKQKSNKWSNMEENAVMFDSFEERAMVEEEDVNVESAIVKIAPKTKPVCKCGEILEKYQLQFIYNNIGKPFDQMATVNCDGCGKKVLTGNNEDEKKQTIIWHCPKNKDNYQHTNGYDLCQDCAQKQLEFDELNGMDMIERDEKYPIRVTLQYYKSTNNGVINKEIMNVIAKELTQSRKASDYVGSLVTEYNEARPTEWIQNLFNNINLPKWRNHHNFKDNSYELISDILGNLNISKYLNSFKKNEIFDSRLILLEENDLNKIFDKVGPMIVFRQWLKSYKDTIKPDQRNNNNNNYGNGILFS